LNLDEKELEEAWRHFKSAEETGAVLVMILGVHHISSLIRSEETLDFYKLPGFNENFRKTRVEDITVLL
jgi:hypothetical protein